jgi:hypothetical protein
MKNNIIAVTNCKAAVLKGEVWKATDDYSLFHITPERTLGDKDLFDGCSFFDLFIDHKTEWGAPIPSTFQHFFKEILKILTPPDDILVLNVVDLYEGYFDQDRFIKDFLKPNGFIYFFIDKEINGTTYRTLFFECPIDSVLVLKDIAFAGTVIDVEGFVIHKSKVGLFPSWQKMGNTDVMFRELLRSVFFAFRLWRDHNGMFIATEKLDIPEVERALSDSSLQQQIRDYISSLF